MMSLLNLLLQSGLKITLAELKQVTDDYKTATPRLYNTFSSYCFLGIIKLELLYNEKDNHNFSLRKEHQELQALDTRSSQHNGRSQLTTWMRCW